MPRGAAGERCSGMKAHRIQLPERRQLVVDRAHGLTIMWIWDFANDRCASGPFAVRESEMPALLTVLAAIDSGAGKPS
jgi:hypothetical protein